jgi:hypothetical protein
MKNARKWVIGFASAFSLSIVNPVAAIEVDPSQAQIEAALDRGKRAAARQQPPETWHARFGGGDDPDPGGLLFRKRRGLSVEVGFSLDFA